MGDAVGASVVAATDGAIVVAATDGAAVGASGIADVTQQSLLLFTASGVLVMVDQN